MTVGELKEILKNYSDDTLILVEGRGFVTKISDVGDVKYKIEEIVRGYETFDYEYDDWDTTKEFANEQNACLITSEDSYMIHIIERR